MLPACCSLLILGVCMCLLPELLFFLFVRFIHLSVPPSFSALIISIITSITIIIIPTGSRSSSYTYLPGTILAVLSPARCVRSCPWAEERPRHQSLAPRIRSRVALPLLITETRSVLPPATGIGLEAMREGWSVWRARVSVSLRAGECELSGEEKCVSGEEGRRCGYGEEGCVGWALFKASALCRADVRAEWWVQWCVGLGLGSVSCAGLRLYL